MPIADRPVGLQLGSYFTASPFRQMVMSTPITSNPTFFAEKNLEKVTQHTTSSRSDVLEEICNGLNFFPVYIVYIASACTVL